MSMIFPGMDPYLEDPQGWPGVHATLIVYIRDQLQPKLRPRYVATVEQRVYLEGPGREISPDVWLRRNRTGNGGANLALADVDAPIVVQVPELEIRETYVAILDRQSGQQVVTVIEVVSPSNKYAGPGRELYLTKQREVRASQANLVEIDLLRYGPHVLAVPEPVARSRGPYDYLICVNRAGALREQYEFYPRRLRDRLPRIRLPLSGTDSDVVLDVQAALAQTYEMGGYRDIVNYAAPCIPPLSPEDQEWANQCIQAAQNQ